MKNASPSLHSSIHQSLLKKNANKDRLSIPTDNRFNNKLSNPIILANKQPLNIQQLHTSSNNTFFQCNQQCRKPRCKVCSHIDIRCSIKFDNDVTISAAKADCDSQNVVYSLFCANCPNAVYVVYVYVLDFDLAITNTALNTIFLVTP